MVTCPWCEKQFQNEEGVVRHSSRIHKKRRIEYDLLVKYNGVIPKCACGCGHEVEYSKHFHGFNRFIWGHQYKDPVVRQQMIEGGKAASKDADIIEAHKNRTTALWADPAYRGKHEAMRSDPNSNWHRNREIALRPIWQSPEFAEASGLRSREWWASEEGQAMREYFKTDEFRNNVSVGTTKGLSDPEIRQMLSEHAISMVEQGIIGPQAPFKTEWKFNPFTGCEEYMHCGWETKFLDAAIVANVYFTKCHGIRIPYNQSDGSKHLYLPDFASPNNRLLVEVKGEEDENDELKYVVGHAWAVDNGWTYRVIKHENEIQSYFTSINTPIVGK